MFVLHCKNVGEKQTMIQPIQYAIYKGMGGSNGAAQFNLQSPHKYCPVCKKRDYTGEKFECGGTPEQAHPKEKLLVREGCVFLEVTSVKDGQKNVYDWEKKIVFALSITDLGKLLYGMRTGCLDKDGNPGEVKITHDPGAGSEAKGKVQKYLSLSSPKGPAAGFYLSMTQFGGQEKMTHKVPITADEGVVLGALFQSAISKLLNW